MPRHPLGLLGCSSSTKRSRTWRPVCPAPMDPSSSSTPSAVVGVETARCNESCTSHPLQLAPDQGHAASLLWGMEKELGRKTACGLWWRHTAIASGPLKQKRASCPSALSTNQRSSNPPSAWPSRRFSLPTLSGLFWGECSAVQAVSSSELGSTPS